MVHPQIFSTAKNFLSNGAKIWTMDVFIVFQLTMFTIKLVT